MATTQPRYGEARTQLSEWRLATKISLEAPTDRLRRPRPNNCTATSLGCRSLYIVCILFLSSNRIQLILPREVLFRSSLFARFFFVHGETIFPHWIFATFQSDVLRRRDATIACQMLVLSSVSLFDLSGRELHRMRVAKRGLVRYARYGT